MSRNVAVRLYPRPSSLVLSADRSDSPNNRGRREGRWGLLSGTERMEQPFFLLVGHQPPYSATASGIRPRVIYPLKGNTSRGSYLTPPRPGCDL